MRKVFFFLCLNYYVLGNIYGQNTIKLTFDEAVKYALENNTQLRQEKNNLVTNVALKNQSLAAYLPFVNGATDFSHIDGLQFDQVTGSLYSSSSNYMRSNITASYYLFDGFGKYNTLRNSKKLMDSQISTVKRTEQFTIYTVAEQFLQVLLDRQLLRIAEENINFQKTTLQQIDGFVLAGTRPLSDKLNQEAEVQRLEVLRIRAENKLRIDRTILSQTLMLDPTTDIDPIEPDWGLEAILAEEFDINELYETALISRPDYMKSVSDQEAAKAFVGIQRAQHFPSLGIFYQYGTSFSSFARDPNSELIPFNDQYFKTNKQTIYGFQVDIPIFNQYRTLAQKTRAKMLLENTNLTEETLKLTIFREVQNAYQNLAAAKREFFATESQFTAAQEANKIQKERYEVGVGDLVELSQATQRFVEAASNRAQSQYTLLFQKVILDYYTGLLSADNLH